MAVSVMVALIAPLPIASFSPRARSARPGIWCPTLQRGRLVRKTCLLRLQLIEGHRGDRHRAVDDRLEVRGIAAVPVKDGAAHIAIEPGSSRPPGSTRAVIDRGLLTAEQGQNELRRRVGLRHGGHRGLLQYLRLGQVGSFRGHVGVPDAGLGGRSWRSGTVPATGHSSTGSGRGLRQPGRNRVSKWRRRSM